MRVTVDGYTEGFGACGMVADDRNRFFYHAFLMGSDLTICVSLNDKPRRGEDVPFNRYLDYRAAVATALLQTQGKRRPHPNHPGERNEMDAGGNRSLSQQRGDRPMTTTNITKLPARDWSTAQFALIRRTVAADCND